MKYIIDTDPGIDDAIAICLAIKNHLDVIGFTLATGNVKKESSKENLKVILDTLSSTAKMYEGKNINPSNGFAHFAHGEDGLGNNFFPKSNREFEKISAEDFIIESANTYQNDLTVVCLGPLTNLASAYKTDPSIANKISEVVIMGASYDETAPSTYKEFNFNVDVESTKVVLNAPFRKIKMVTHEVGALSFIEKDYMDSLYASTDKVTNFVYKIAKKYIEFSKEHNNIIGLSTPDPTTIASILDPSIVSFMPCTVKTDDNSFDVSKTDNSNIYVSTNFDLEKFRQLFKNTFKLKEQQTKKVMINGKEIEIVTKLSDTDMDYDLPSNLENTADLSKVIESTMRINMGDINE